MSIPFAKVSILWLILFFAISVFLVSNQVQAQTDCVAKGATTERGLLTTGLSNECVGCGDCSQCDILMVVKNIVQFILKIAGLLAILAIILGGFLYVTSGGSEERAQAAKGAITAAIVGFIIVLVAWVLVNFIIQILTGGSQNIFDAAWYSPKCQ
ncbi:MAG: pilin [Patescibacteria group bacterium]